MADITLIPLAPEDQEQFILDNQEAFNYGALEEFGRRNEEFEEDEQIISKDTIQQSIYIPAVNLHWLRSLVCGGKDAP